MEQKPTIECVKIHDVKGKPLYYLKVVSPNKEQEAFHINVGEKTFTTVLSMTRQTKMPFDDDMNT